MRRKRSALILLILLFVGAVCSSDSKIEPKEISYGQDICDRCKMIISEKPYSTQYVLSGSKVKKFDDLGCMFYYLDNDERRRDEILAFFVRDFESGEWIDGKEAYYVLSKRITTPMNHGLVAFEDKDTAEKLAGVKNGTVVQGLEDAVNMFLAQNPGQQKSR